jgi:succinate dehydrogenase/fumarate reductase flavoprotein subunit
LTRIVSKKVGKRCSTLQNNGMLEPSQAETAAVVKQWDFETDVLCVGYGGAGAVAAIAAHDAGAEVLIIEKMASGGGNTRVSAGGFLSPSNSQDASTYIQGLFELSHSDMDESQVRVYAEESVKNANWIKGLKPGTEVVVYGGAGYPNVPGAASMKKYNVRGEGRGMTGSARNLWGLLAYAVEDARKIPVMYQTPAQRLLTNGEGAVIGVVAVSKGKEIRILARRGVVLTLGGYEFDQTALRNFVKGYPIYATGTPGNTGDGLRMAQKVGAGLWHMNGVSCVLGIKVPEVEAAFPALIATPRHIFVDKHGRRFVNEKALQPHAGLLATDYFDSHAVEYPRIPMYVIFDETARKAGPISVLAGLGYAALSHSWSKDNSVEIDKGWILKGNTISELAGKIKTMDAAILEETIARWNEDVKNGEDTQFHRPLRQEQNPSHAPHKDLVTQTWSAPIDTAPFYALALYPSLLNTHGGPKHNAKAQVLDAFGKPISHLYSAGEFGSMWGIIYQGSGNLGECLVFGRIAGKNAAKENLSHNQPSWTAGDNSPIHSSNHQTRAPKPDR